MMKAPHDNRRHFVLIFTRVSHSNKLFLEPDNLQTDPNRLNLKSKITSHITQQKCHFN